MLGKLLVKGPSIMKRVLKGPSVIKNKHNLRLFGENVINVFKNLITSDRGG